MLPRHTARTFAGCLLMRPRWHKKAPANAGALSIVNRLANQWMASFFSRSSKYFPEVLVGFAQVVDRPARMQDGGVVLAATVQSDVGQRRLGHLLGEVHRNLAGLDNFALAGLALEQLNGQIEVIAHHLLDVVNADFTCGVLDKLVDHVLRQVQGDGLAVQAGLGHQGYEGPSNSRTLVVML